MWQAPQIHTAAPAAANGHLRQQIPQQVGFSTLRDSQQCREHSSALWHCQAKSIGKVAACRCVMRRGSLHHAWTLAPEAAQDGRCMLVRLSGRRSLVIRASPSERAQSPISFSPDGAACVHTPFWGSTAFELCCASVHEHRVGHITELSSATPVTAGWS